MGSRIRFSRNRSVLWVGWVVGGCCCLASWAAPVPGGGGAEWKVPGRHASAPNPVAPDEASIELGRRLFARECASCHGARGLGDGKSAKDLEKPVPALTRVEVVAQTDGALFWKTSVGRKPMPAFQSLLSDDERWHLVNYLRELSASRAPVTPRFELPDPARETLAALITSYLDVGRTLAADQDARPGAAVVLERAQALAPSDGIMPEGCAPWTRVRQEILEAATALAAAADLAGERHAYEDLSDALALALADFARGGDEPLSLYRCPSGPEGKTISQWVQLGTTPVNPYGCGAEGAHFVGLLLPRPERHAG